MTANILQDVNVQFHLCTTVIKLCSVKFNYWMLIILTSPIQLIITMLTVIIKVSSLHNYSFLFFFKSLLFFVFSKEAARQSHPTKQFTTPEQVNIVLMHLQSRGFLNHKNKIKDTLKNNLLRMLSLPFKNHFFLPLIKICV